MTRQRNIDAVHGLMLIYMIYGHIIDTFQNSLEPFFFMFMQWFFFNSGVFYKGYVTKSDFTKSIITYIKYSAIGYILYLVYIYLKDGNIQFIEELSDEVYKLFNHLTVNGNGALWFLLSLFVVKCLYSIVKDKKVCLTLIVIGLLVSYTLNLQGFIEPIWVANISTGVSFFGLGILLRDIQYNKVVFVCLTLLFFVIGIIHPSYLHVHNNQLFCGNFILCFIASLGGIVFYNNIFKIIGGCKPLEYIGKNAMKLYVWHMPFITISKVFLVITTGVYISDNKFYCGAITIFLLFFLLLYNSIEQNFKTLKTKDK